MNCPKNLICPLMALHICKIIELERSSSTTADGRCGKSCHEQFHRLLLWTTQKKSFILLKILTTHVLLPKVKHDYQHIDQMINVSKYKLQSFPNCHLTVLLLHCSQKVCEQASRPTARSTELQRLIQSSLILSCSWGGEKRNEKQCCGWSWAPPIVSSKDLVTPFECRPSNLPVPP